MTLKVGRCLLVPILKRIGWTQQGLADDINMDKRQLSRYITRDIECMELPTSVRISDALSRKAGYTISPRDLYEWSYEG
jgi:plasmid maintenance system antidote protein VapI